MQQDSYIRSLKSRMRNHAKEKGCADLQVDLEDPDNETDDFRPNRSFETAPRKKDL